MNCQEHFELHRTTMKVVFIIMIYRAWSAFGLYIAYGDHDFVGEDPVLAAELKRRMALIEPPPPDPSEYPDTEPTSSRRGQSSPNATDFTAGMAPGPNDTGRRQYPANHNYMWWRYSYIYFDLDAATSRAVGKGRGDQGKFIEFKQDWNSTNIYALHLKAAEQIIYGLQERIKDLERIAGHYNSSNQMRIAYSLKRLDLWYEEMEDYYEYSHKKFHPDFHPPVYHASWWMKWYPHSKENPWYFPNIRHILYYQELQKRYINMIYTIEFVRKLHAQELAKNDEDNGLKVDNNTMAMMAGNTKKPPQCAKGHGQCKVPPI